MAVQGPRDRLGSVIVRYYEGCNEADRGKMLECLAPDAVHFFPDGAPQGPFRGAAAIADGWIAAVERLGSQWTIDRMIVDEDRGEAAVEWTHHKRRAGLLLRGDEWFCFDPLGRISEIRAYYACPPAGEPRDHHLGGFDYAARGYAA